MKDNCFYTKYGLGDLVRIKLSGCDRFLDLHIDHIHISFCRNSDYRYYYQSTEFSGLTFDDHDIICYVKED